MSRKVFTAGEVLAAADVNSFLMDQTVMSFAGTAARGSAIPTPTAGMTSYREDTNRLESYTGSIWTSPSDLVLVKSQTIGSGVSSVVVTDAFSATYDAYKVIVSGGVASANGGMTFKLGSASSGHANTLAYIAYSGGALLTTAQSNGASFNNIGTGDTGFAFAEVNLWNPFLSQTTFMTALYADAGASGITSGRHLSNTSFTGFTFAPGSGTLTGGTINVYGYRKTT